MSQQQQVLQEGQVQLLVVTAEKLVEKVMRATSPYRVLARPAHSVVGLLAVIACNGSNQFLIPTRTRRYRAPQHRIFLYSLHSRPMSDRRPRSIFRTHRRRRPSKPMPSLSYKEVVIWKDELRGDSRRTRFRSILVHRQMEFPTFHQRRTRLFPIVVAKHASH